jgi:hypothetical protein
MRARRDAALYTLPLVAALVACATTPVREPVPQMPERAAAYAQPEPDPACRGMVQESLAARGLDRVVVKLARAPDGGVRVVELVAPDLTPAAKVELTRAFGECAWSPPPPAEGAPVVAPAEVWTNTFVREQSPAPAR